jgi:hypothetical protein
MILAKMTALAFDGLIWSDILNILYTLNQLVLEENHMELVVEFLLLCNNDTEVKDVKSHVK